MRGKPTPPPAALLDAAVSLHQAGELDAAAAAYFDLAKGPVAQRRRVLPFLALLERQRNRPVAALAIYDQLLALGERGPDLFQTRGDLLSGLGRHAHALASYDRALQLDPRLATVWTNRGATLEALGKLKAAVESHDRALALRPDYPEAWFNRAAALAELGQAEAALESLERTLALRPDHAAAWNNRGLLLAAAGRLDEAVESYDRAVAVTPAYAEALNNRSAGLRRLGRLDEALQSAEAALALRPAYPEALNSRGLANAALMRFEAALASYDHALQLRPAYPEALSNSGLALAALGRLEAALERYQAALALDPAFADAEFNSGLTLLRLYRFGPGWRRHEARRRQRHYALAPFPEDRLWLGEDGVAGRTLLLHAEQGLGDTLQFCRFAPGVAALGARVVLQVQPGLTRLMSGMQGIDRVVAVGEPPPVFDLHTPLMSLPLALGAEVETLPSPPYLEADLGAVAAWTQRLATGSDRGLRVGLVWSGNPAHENDRNRSLPLEALGPLLEAGEACGCRFVSLQKEVRAADAATLAASPVLDVAEALGDFADTAALVAACDLVISVDTAAVHLAGALGRPAWVLLPRFSDWRWGTPDDEAPYERTPWYPAMRLYRQRAFGDWAEAVSRIAADLTAMGGQGPPAR